MPLQASTPAIHTQESLRGGVPPFNGGLGVGAMRAPRVSRGFSASRQPPDPGSAPTRKIETHKYISFAAPLSTTTYRSLPHWRSLAFGDTTHFPSPSSNPFKPIDNASNQSSINHRFGHKVISTSRKDSIDRQCRRVRSEK